MAMFSFTELFYPLALVASLGGLILASYIAAKKHTGPLVCPIGHDCTTVVHSEYSEFLGFPLELLGIVYYSLSALFYGSMFAFPEYATEGITFIGILFSTAAFIFSAYLVFIQGYVLRQWCTWCLMSAGLSTLIFYAALAGTAYSLPILFGNYQAALSLMHFLGIAIGVGAVTITDIFFFKFLGDLRISEWEANVLKIHSQTVWFGLILLVVSGAGLYIPNAEILNHTPKFLAKVFIVAVIVINGAILNLVVAPHLVHLSFGLASETAFRGLRKLGFVLGAISLSSWYAALVLGALPDIPLGFWSLILLYGALEAIALAASQIIELVVERKSRA